MFPNKIDISINLFVADPIGLVLSNSVKIQWGWYLENETWQQCDQKKSPNVYKSCPKMISLEKWYILTPTQKLPKNVRFGQINYCQRL